jgi:ribosomal-protein-alanine N-acetyltransferase
MLNTSFVPFPVLETSRLLLRQLKETDADEIFFLRTDARVLQYLDRPAAKLKVEAEAYIEMINGQIANAEAVLWGITMKPDDRLIGSICFWHFERENFRAETGYVLHPDHHGKGIMKEAMNSILEYGFNTMNLHSVTANVNPQNAASIRLLKSTGFEQEAYFRENFFFNGQFIDTVILTRFAGQQ